MINQLRRRRYHMITFYGVHVVESENGVLKVWLKPLLPNPDQQRRAI